MGKNIILLGFIVLSLMIIGCLGVNANTINIGDYIDYAQQNECYNIHFGCENCSYVNLTVLYPNGSYVFQNGEMTTDDGFFYNYTFCNTTEVGKYFIYFHYDENDRGYEYIYTDEDYLYVTQNPLQDLACCEGQGLIGLGSILVMLAFIGLLVALAFSINKGFVKFVLFVIAFIVFLMTVLHTTVLMQQSFSDSVTIYSGIETFLFVIQVLGGIAILGLLLYGGYMAVQLWRFKRGLRDD